MRRKSSLTSHLESDIIKQVRSTDGISRVELARVLHLAASTAGTYVERLIKLGYIVEQEKATRGSGRPPVLLRLNPAGGAFIGVEFEARNIRAVAVDFADRPQRNAYRPVDEDEDASSVMRKIEEAVAEVMPAGRGTLLAIGVGVPGIIDPVRGLGLSYKYIVNWRNVAVRDRLAKKFGVPVFLESNIRAMALAESWFGQGRGRRNFICVGVRSGIGLGMVLDGRLFRGEHFNAGLFGRWRCSISPEIAGWCGAAPSDAGAMELQEVASARSIPRAIQAAIKAGESSLLKKVRGTIPLADVIEAARQRDDVTLRVLEQSAVALGQAIGRLVLVTDTPLVILAGPLTQLGDIFLRPVSEEVKRTVGDTGLQSVAVVNSTIGDFCGALGAAALALEEWKPASTMPRPGLPSASLRPGRPRPGPNLKRRGRGPLRHHNS
ncbi:MAG: ROK family transcriptional regulator [Opitutus sp.]|nr:ROK family transcriptional regulator [Opitutus sp.]